MLYLFDAYALDTDRRELRRGEAPISLEPQVFDLLEYLIRNRERVVTRDDLFASIWTGRVVSDSALASRINAARTAIGDSGGEQRLIRTLPRKGVRFIGAVREERPEAGRGTAGQARSAFAVPDRPSIAVLAFTNMSGDPEQEYFADGMAEEIITALSRCASLFVIARNSSFSYKGRSVDVRQIGRELGVRYVLEGSVRRGGDRLRITGQLTDSTLGTNIWADRFDGDRQDVFELQDRITERVVAAIEPRLLLAEIERVRHKSAANLDAYDLLLQAQQQEYEFTEASLAGAIRLVEEALRIDPGYAPAMALGAYCYAERRFQGWTRDLEAEKARGLGLALRSTEIGRNDANVLWMAAYAFRELAMDARHSKALVDRSLQLNPNSAIALTIAAWNEIVLSDPAAALEMLQRAERLSPRDPRAWFMATAGALAHIAQGHFDRAAVSAKRALAQNPRSAQALRMLAASLAKMGELDGARQTMEEVMRMEPQLTVARLRERLQFMPEAIWAQLGEGLRLAGLPE